MSTEADNIHLQAFAARVHELCDDMGVAQGRGRQSALAAVFGVNPKAARKWLLGLGYPEMDMAQRMASWGNVSLLWLLQGRGSKREGTPVDTKTVVLQQALRDLPPDLSIDWIDNLRGKLIRVGKLDPLSPNSKYKAMLEAFELELAGRVASSPSPTPRPGRGK